MAVVDGLRFGNDASTAWLQSKYSVVSCLAQNRRSASSEAKRGIGFRATLLRLLIDSASRFAMSVSKNHLQRNLNLPRRSRRRGDFSHVQNRSFRGAGAIGQRSSE